MKRARRTRRSADAVRLMLARVPQIVASPRDSFRKNAPFPGTAVPGYRLWRPFGTKTCKLCRPSGTQRKKPGLQIVASLRGLVAYVALGTMLVTWCPHAWGLDAALDVSQYAHTAWRVREGFVKGPINSIAQTPDGYLWLGTDFGLYRFDGVRAIPWQPPAGEQLPSNTVYRLLVARDGTLWISTLKGLASWKDGRLTQYPEVAGQLVGPLLEDHDGTVWFGAYAPGKLCSVQGGKVGCYGAGSFSQGISALYEDHKGNLWLSAETGIWRWKPGPPENYRLPGAAVKAHGLTEDDKGTLLVAATDGLKQLVGGKIQDYALPNVTGQFRPIHFFRSRDGSLWVGTLQGLLHLHRGRTDRFAVADGLSGDVITSIFEDREGNVWVSTLNGLDRFREYAVQRISWNQGLSTSDTYSIQATADGTIWIGTSNGLNRWQNGQLTIYGQRSARRDEQELRTSGAIRETANSGFAGRPASLGLDRQGRLWASSTDGIFYFEGGRFIRVPGATGGNIFGIAAERSGTVWISYGKQGLSSVAQGDAVPPIPWSRLGHEGFGARALTADPSQGGVWLGFYEGQLLYFKDGQVHASYSATDGLGNGRVNQLRFGSLNGLLAATEGGLSRVKDGRVATLTSKNGLPCDEVHWSVEDEDHSVWVYMPCGLARIAPSEWRAWVSDPRRPIQTTIYDSSDGVPSVGVYGSIGPHVTQSPDGRIWFLNREGVSVIDPRHLPHNKLPPPVHIEQIIADRKIYDPASYGNGHVPLPARARDVEIDYTALSYAAPEKVRFRYKLEGRDGEWQDAGNRRQAFYSDLPPRSYRFRVIARNNSGVWNEEGAFVDFAIAPAYYQTNWFRALCVAALLALAWGVYQLRLGQLAREFNAGLEARVAERTRIARELHDSLLQGFQGLMFHLQAVRDLLPRRPTEAMRALDVALERGDKSIAEARDTVSDLREPIVSDKDVAAALTALGEELAAQNDNGSVPCFRVLMEGKRRELDPALRDEVYRIGREAMRNAFCHARAKKIETELTYRDSEFLLHVRDDGIGIAPEIADQGARAGHWGLPGMRERAKSFGGKLEVWSEHGAGTEIELSVPAAIAYGGSRAGRRFWFSRKKIEGINGKQS